MRCLLNSHYRFLTALLCSALFLLAGFCGQVARADSWADAEAAAAKEIYIPGVRLVTPQEGGFTHGVHLAYVTETTKPGNGKYSCTPLSSVERAQASRVIGTALQKLGAESVQRLGLKYVLLCDEAQAGGRVIGGIPVPPIKLLMLAAGGGSDAYRERIFFHELYHYMEFTQRGGLKDPAWDKQFSAGYGGGYGAADASSSQMGGGAAGFVSRYAQSLPEEDRAEIFSFLMTDPQGLSALAARKQDKVLQAKIAYINDVIKNQFGMK